jgi:hypothetical protein
VLPMGTYNNPEPKIETGVPLKQHLTHNSSATWTSCSSFFSVYVSKYLISSHRSGRQPLSFRKNEGPYAGTSPLRACHPRTSRVVQIKNVMPRARNPR